MKGTLATIDKNALEEVRIDVSNYRGYDLVDIRVWRKGNGFSESIPTRKGIAVQLKLLPELITALKEAEMCIERQESVSTEGKGTKLGTN